MFVYERDGKLNIMMTGNKPAVAPATPDIVIEPVAGDPITVKILVNGVEYLEAVPAASPTVVGGAKAAAAGAGDTVEVKIKAADGKFYVPTYPVLPVAATTEAAGIVSMAAAQEDSEAVTLEGVVAGFNALLAKLRAAGIMAPSGEEE